MDVEPALRGAGPAPVYVEPSGATMQTTRPGRHPHEIVMAGISIISGCFGLASDLNASLAITRALPGWFAVLFFSGLILGGMVTLFGISREKIDGFLLERAGLVLLATMYLAYGVAVISLFGERVVMASVMPLTVAIANSIRAFQITRALRDWRGGGSSV